MAITTVGMFPYPGLTVFSLGAATDAAKTMDATGEMLSSIHTIVKAGDIRKVHFFTGTVVNAQTIRVSLQNISSTTGDADGTQDQYNDVSIADTDDSVWKTTGNLSADRTVAVGDIVAVVFEFNPFNTGNIFRLRAGINSVWGKDYCSQYIPTTWTKNAGSIILALEYSDGSIMEQVGGSPPCKAISTTNLVSSTNPVRLGNRINLPFSLRLSGVSFYTPINSATTQAKVTLCSSDGYTVLATALPNTRGGIFLGTTAYTYYYGFSSSQTLSANTDYYIYIENTSSTNLTVTWYEFNSDALRGSSQFKYFRYNTQHSTNAPTETNTRVVHMNVIVDGIETGSAGGGLLVHPGMAGGMRG